MEKRKHGGEEKKISELGLWIYRFIIYKINENFLDNSWTTQSDQRYKRRARVKSRVTYREASVKERPR